MKNITAGVAVKCYRKHLYPVSKFKIRSFKDYRIGVHDSIKHKIMQAFFTTKPTEEGTGLGLSLSYDILVKGHNGTLDIIGKEGEGSEFIVKLPILT